MKYEAAVPLDVAVARWAFLLAGQDSLMEVQQFWLDVLTLRKFYQISNLLFFCIDNRNECELLFQS